MLSLADPVQATSTDHFFGPSISEIHIEEGSRGKRPKALKHVIRAMENSVLGQNPDVPGTLPACKMLNLLQASGVRSVSGPRLQPEFRLRGEFNTALNSLANEGPNSQFLAAALDELEDGLVWYSAKSGPFASLNFERNHAHAVLGAPKTDSSDKVLLGITIMAPYTRFPDYVLRLPRVMFPLSPGEYKSISGEWKSHQIGSPIVCAAGREFAMRCASQPLLSLWCQRLAT
ncbi:MULTISPECIES: dimethylsulfonioproprionate lyase family protein [Rhizobium/Agrobacterium group]|uniref:Uncharacterized protein n=2 Tax=Agrobacterium TaxID=357 RepID=A0A546XJ54_AGRTU|nr:MULTISPECIES: dimethylsulfonioproprionate lyase family protein [Rhizobium/Agrobacterium group]MCZ7472262.1 dimethylsulfonioproprionate lyase family protein [Rhizobium rhizogenes]MCZ7483289.1 dimethylsulfonioproprionate lyase family protein [Rhizobium rhizogenes]MCZ7501732.1 dimethylsulfonioproprionate lyase family protein [Rhizobium rhizogenes]MEB3046145.1 dimethylsulfonioproprionate lyase family protein [Rhizobium sp. MJ21]TRB00771.1 hypothetical protein EXN61_24835 [Agrobacterium tumefaci